MIISENKKPSIDEFRCLMQKTDELLNKEAVGKQEYYKGRNSSLLEHDVFEALRRCAVNTPFEGSLELISGASFPDIVASKFYGVEVKSTNKNHWKSIGSSILESTRNQNVERIFLTFGKLGNPVSFISRPYEECLSGISVTHYPRYQIDMKLEKGQTIFDKMELSYDELRKMENPVAPVAQYYKKQLKSGESLWWAAGESIDEPAAPPVLRLWTSLSPEEKNYYTVKGYALFPEILSYNSQTKYNRYALWLVSSCSIVNTNIRDQFSAGGKVDITTPSEKFEKMPAAMGRIDKNCTLIKETILDTDETILCEYWQVEAIFENRIEQWCKIASDYAEDKHEAYRFLKNIFQV